MVPPGLTQGQTLHCHLWRRVPTLGVHRLGGGSPGATRPRDVGPRCGTTGQCIVHMRSKSVHVLRLTPALPSLGASQRPPDSLTFGPWAPPTPMPILHTAAKSPFKSTNHATSLPAPRPQDFLFSPKLKSRLSLGRSSGPCVALCPPCPPTRLLWAPHCLCLPSSAGSAGGCGQKHRLAPVARA